MNDEFVEVIADCIAAPLKLCNFWLRDHCRCKTCYAFDTFQRNLNLMDIPLNIKPLKHYVRGSVLSVSWSDGHESVYDIVELQAQQLSTYTESHAIPKIFLWNHSQIEDSDYARVPLETYMTNEAVAKSVVQSLVTYGLAFVNGVEATEAATEATVRRLFDVQKTFFGVMWTFSDDMIHSDSAYSKSYLGAHVDNTYFNDAAGLQVLHCIRQSDTGGESLLLDGFRALDNFKTKNPEAYDRLCRTHVAAEYIETKQHHTHSAPIIRLDPFTGQPEQIRFNLYDRSFMRTLPQSEMLQFYKDLRMLTSEIQSPANEWWFKLQPGTVMLFDNWRLLHGRAAYTGRRQITGCYVSRTEFLSVARRMGIID